ncbi:hypothetical protein X274_07925 [Marinitoga sp. 1155]|nr:hypothetical protein X274_07925 [Marinitoga sp. 1155]
MIKAILIKIIKNLNSTSDLIDELYSNPYLAQAIGFDPIRNYVPAESTFSMFRKSFDINIIYLLITDLLFKGISAGFISTEFLSVDSFPILFDSHFNNSKSFKLCNNANKFKDYYSLLDADYGVKPISNDNVKFYDNNDNPKKVMFYVGYKAHVISFLNIPIFTIVTPASTSDSSIFNLLLKLVMGCLEFTGSKVLADKGYDSSRIYDFVHLVFDGSAFIPLRSNSVQYMPKGDCGVDLELHSQYFEKNRGIYRSKFVCPFVKEDKPDSCSKLNCYRYQNYSKNNFRMLFFRNSAFFKESYSKRPLIESLFFKVRIYFISY